MADIVVCSDGTWNTPDDLDAGLPAPTNVYKIYNMLATTGEQDKPIVAYYHPGVGTDGGPVSRLSGGGMGVGLSENVRSAYRWLAKNYRPGDRIWLFGFSRGAFTVRSLGGLISRCGLLDPKAKSEAETWAAVEAAYDDYRAGKTDVVASKARPLHGLSVGEKARNSTPIHFIGVWDTVGALGVPDDLALLDLIDDPKRYEFHDTALSDNVVHARHAIALDERRQSFTPTLWVDTPPQQDVLQVWFPGVHSDVGGGYGRCGLSDGALGWMIGEAEKSGLVFRQEAVAQLDPNPRGVLHDSVTGVFKSLKTRPREAPPVDRSDPIKAIHPSVYERQKNPPIAQPAYWPVRVLKAGETVTGIDVFARERWNATGLYLEKNKTYEFKAEGEWLDKNAPCGPDGLDNGKFDRGDFVRSVFSGVGWTQTAFNKLTGNAQPDFLYTKRAEAIGWFVLTGMIASGEWFKANGSLAARPLKSGEQRTLTLNETFEIGNERTFKPKASGYLYCFANDAWQTYDNNRGSVRLTVKRV